MNVHCETLAVQTTEPPIDTLRSLVSPAAVTTVVAAAAVAALSLRWGGAHTRGHAGAAFAGAALALFVARRWQLPYVPPERLARALLISSLLFAGAAQLLEASGALGADRLHDVGSSLGRLAVPLVLLALAGAVGVALAKSSRARSARGGRW